MRSRSPLCSSRAAAAALHPRRWGSALAVLAVLAAPVPWARAQEPTGAAPEASPTPAVIPGARIVESIDQTRARLRDLQATAAPDPSVAEIESILPTTLQDLDELDAELQHA